MFPMTPEDLYRQVARSQDQARQQVARERMAMAASAPRTTRRTAVRNTVGSAVRTLSHNAWMTARQLLHTVTAPGGVARHRAR
jgi:hypothetical protein